MDTSIIGVDEVNTSKVKYTKYEEPSVTDNSIIEVIKAPGSFKLFECGKSSLTTWIQLTNARAFQMRRETIRLNV